MKIKLLAFLASTSAVFGSVSIDLQIGQVSQNNGSPIQSGAYGILVADTGNNGFAGDYMSNPASADFSAFDGLTFTVGNTFGTDDEIVGVFNAFDLGGFMGFNGGPTFTLPESTPLGFYWFPSDSPSASISGSVAEYGFYRSDVVDVDSGSDIAFSVPTDGGLGSTLATFSQDINPSGIPTASDFTAVPEPAHFALAFGALAMGLAFWRRRK